MSDDFFPRFQPDRRAVLRLGAGLAAGIAGLAAAGGAAVRAATSTGSTTGTAMAGWVPDDWLAAFEAALPRDARLLGFRTPKSESLAAEALTDGRWPAELRGRFYRNGPAQHEVGGQRYHHWFDGDGMVHRFTIADGRVRHLGRFVETAKRREEKAAGLPLLPTFGTALPVMRPMRSADATNVANINILEQGGRLLALWEGGSAYELQRADLATIGPLTWSAETEGVPFSAHPKLESDGTLWNFGVAPYADSLVLFRIDPAGRLADHALHRLPGLGMAHDFVVTERHLVIPLPPLAMNLARFAAGESYLDAHDWLPDRPMRIAIVPKDDLASLRLVEAAPAWIFHFGPGWEEADGTLRFQAARYPDPGIMYQTLRHVMRGEWRPSPPAMLTEYRIRPGAAVAEESVGSLALEFPTFDPRLDGRRARRLFGVTGGATPYGNFGATAIVGIDLESGRVDRFDYGPACFVEEHVFVPRPDGGEGGWLLGTAMEQDRRVTRLSLFDAQRLSDGPVAVARLPYALPLGLHGSFARA